MTGTDADIRTLVEIGDTIAAIRLHRERHGGSLTDARAAIEAIRWAITQARGSQLGPGHEIDELLRRGDRITAIRRHREATGCSLKEAMDAIEARQPAAPVPAPAPAPAPNRATDPLDVHGLQPDLDRLICGAEFIPAVEHYQARTGASVQDAIAAVDARRLALFKLEKAAQAPADSGLQPELDRLIEAREIINAIKHHRRVTGLSLKECKDAVDARAAALGVRR
jgi:ribosomal protein L7/L12